MSGILVCPKCKSPLKILHDANSYNCAEHGEFPIVEGYPSFVQDYDQEFEKHWEENKNAHVPQIKISVAEEFLHPIFERLDTIDKPVILDAGCGEGAHAAAISRRYENKDNLVYYGMDIAVSGLKQSDRESSKRFRFIHGDISELPFQDNSFDAVFCFGVLHLTQNPEQTFKELARVLKPGGVVGIWVFGSGMLMKIGLRICRGICQLTGDRGTSTLAELITPFYGILPTRSGLSASNGGAAETKEVLMSNLTPPYMHYLTAEKFAAWAIVANMESFSFDDQSPVTFWGNKNSSSVE